MLALLLRLFAVTVCLGIAAEIGVRSLIVAPASIEAHPELGWLYTPGARVLHTSEGYASHTMNALGLNDRELPGSEEPLLVVLGDSFVESLQLDATLNFTSLLETMSNCAEVVNAGRSGISPLNFPAMYSHVANSSRIAGVIATVGPGDFQDIKNATLSVQRDPNGAITSLGFSAAELNPLRKRMDAVLRRSALATYLLNRLKAARAPAAAQSAANVNTTDPADVQRREELADDVLSYTFSQLAHEDVLILYLPEIAYSEHRAARPTEASNRFLTLVRRAAERRGLQVVDTSAALIEHYKLHGQPGHGFANNSAVNGHLNAAGHRVVARVLADAVQLSTLCP